MTDHANELRRYARKIAHPAGDVPSVMLAAADEIERLHGAIASLRAKIAEMERQEPVAWVRGRDNHRRRKLSFEKPAKSSPDKFPLYALPGAQPAPSIPDDVMRDAKRYRFLRAAKNIPISTEAARDPIAYDAAIDAAMLAAAPEAKP